MKIRNQQKSKLQKLKRRGRKNEFRHWSVLRTEVPQFKPIKLKFVLKPHQPENSAQDLPPLTGSAASEQADAAADQQKLKHAGPLGSSYVRAASTRPPAGRRIRPDSLDDSPATSSAIESAKISVGERGSCFVIRQGMQHIKTKSNHERD
jgi:hypothetical protein